MALASRSKRVRNSRLSLYDVGRQDGVDFLVMEYLQGKTLSAR